MTRLPRVVGRLAAAGILLVVGLGAYAWTHRSVAAPSYSPEQGTVPALPLPLRNGPEHDAAKTRNGGEPYILEVSAPGGGAILYYGASHTTDRRHPQVADIAERWRSFQPTVAFYEGRARAYFYGALIEPFAGMPEPALVHKLARRDGVTLYSLEPPYEDEVAGLLVGFTADAVAIYFFLRVYVSEAGGSADEGLAADLLASRTDVDGLRGTLPTIAHLDYVWRRDFPSLPDWRTLTAEPDVEPFVSLTRESQRIRGEHMIRALAELAMNGERVFAVVGSGHVIRQEWNLRALFGMEPAWDQPATAGAP